MPRKATIGPAVYERVNQLVSEGKTRTEAFTQIAQERSSRPGTIAANYYRTARAQPSAGGVAAGARPAPAARRAAQRPAARGARAPARAAATVTSARSRTRSATSSPSSCARCRSATSACGSCSAEPAPR